MIEYKVLWRYIYSSEVFCDTVKLHEAFKADDEIYRKQVAVEYFLEDLAELKYMLDEINIIAIERVDQK